MGSPTLALGKRVYAGRRIEASRELSALDEELCEARFAGSTTLA